MNDKNIIYNLQFPDYIQELNIGGYKFTRIPDYEKAYSSLQHLITSQGGEFPTKYQTGSHQITAILESPDIEKPCILPWADENKLIQDVLLLLTLFTGRNVFRNEWGTQQEIIILQDSRKHRMGGELSLAIHEIMLRHKKTGIIVAKEKIASTDIINYYHIDMGFEKNINHILELISTEEWQNKYEKGFFLFIYRQAAQQLIIDTSFILCWSIWEHIVTLHHKKWLSRRAIEKLDSIEKISFILSEYFLKNIDNKVRKQIEKLSVTRNRLMHYGMIPEEADLKEMMLFKKLTEQLIAMTLGLKPTNVLNSADELQKFLDGEKLDDLRWF